MLSLQFYRMLLLFNIACSLLGIALVWYGFGFINSGNVFLAKLLGFTGAVVLYQYNAKETYYYFRNAGCRVRRITVIAFLADFLVYILLVLLFNLAGYAAAYLKS